MSLCSIVQSVGKYQPVWNTHLESMIASSTDADKFHFRFKNNERPGLGCAGYGTALFSELFTRKVPLIANIINSTLVYICGTIDDTIDNRRTNKKENSVYLESFDHFLKTGENFESLHPFREFLVNNFPKHRWEQLLEKLTAHKDAAINELYAKTYQDLKESRVQIGSTYGVCVAEIISAFADIPLSLTEIKILKDYSIGCTLLDSIADYYDDKLAKRPTPISLMLSGNLKKNFTVIRQEIADVNTYFAEARTAVDTLKKEHYDSMITLTKIFYGLDFAKKLAAYLLDPLIYTEARVGKSGYPFKIYKLRTMKRESLLDEKQIVDNGLRESVDYARVTPFGRFMRKYWLDEIPQIINVLKGEMSFIGPRAVNYPYFSTLPEDLQKERVSYKPGVATPVSSIMVYSGLDRNNAERLYLSQRAQSSFVQIKSMGLLLKSIFSGKLRGI
ncbi:MAG: sugar transferase [Candidatus Woesearchaeota archaeon]